MWFLQLSSLYYSCDFQISISFMSQKCQNLLPSKINSVKRHRFVKKHENRNIFFFHIQPIRHTMVEQRTFSFFSCSKKVLTLCRILCGYSLPLPFVVKTLIILVWRQVKKVQHIDCIKVWVFLKASSSFFPSSAHLMIFSSS